MKKSFSYSNLYVASIISGIMVGTSYIPFPPWAMFFSLIPLLLVWLKLPAERKSLKTIFLTGWITQFILTLIGFNWVIYTIHEFGRMPWSLSAIGLLVFCSFANLHIPLAGVVWHLLFRRTQNPAVKITALTTLLAISERIYPMIFDWHMGYTWLWARFPAYQLADMVGFFGLSTITWFFQGATLYTWVKFRDHSTKKYYGFATALAVFAVLNLAGWLNTPGPLQNPQNLKVAIIQANIGNLEKQYAAEGTGFRQSIIDRYTALSRKELANAPDFLLWPETAYPDYLTEDAYQTGVYGTQVRNFLKENQATLLTGAYGFSFSGQMTNSFMALSGDGFLQEPYNKTHLLAFGEFIPGSIYFPIFKKWLPMVADFARGPGPTVMTVNNHRLGIQICYEGLFDRFTRSLSHKGAAVIFNVTNDSWYGTWQEPYQHMYMTLARSIEVRLPLIRATNTGISTVQLPDGTTLEQSPMQEPWSHTYTVPYTLTPKRTLFAGFGYFVFPILLVALGVWTIINRRA